MFGQSDFSTTCFWNSLRGWIRIVVFSLVLTPLSADLTAQDAGRFLRWLGEDARAFVTDVGPQTPMYILAGSAFLAPASLMDEPMRDLSPKELSGSFGGYLKFANTLGSSVIIPVAASVFGLSLLGSNESYQNTAFTSLEAMVYASAVTRIIKGVVGRVRPYEAEGAYEFKPFSGNYSFPSGHTTVIFAAITPWALSSGRRTHWLLVLSASGAMARVAKNKHWTTDVLAGAAIGFFTARYFTRRHSGTGASSAVVLRPYLSPHGAGFSLQVDMNGR